MTRPIGCSTILFHMRPPGDAVRLIREAGFDRIDLAAVPHFAPHIDLDDPSDANLESVVRLVEGLKVSSINCVPWVGIDPADSDALLRRAQVAIAAGQAVHAPILTIDAGKQLDGESRAQAIARWAAWASSVIDASAGTGLDVQIETPHTGTLGTTVAESIELLDALGGGIKATYDTSHIVVGGDTAASSIAEMGDRIGHIHLRDAKDGDIHFTPGDGEYDFATLVAWAGDRSMSLEPEFGGKEMTTEEFLTEARRGRDYIASL